MKALFVISLVLMSLVPFLSWGTEFQYNKVGFVRVALVNDGLSARLSLYLTCCTIIEKGISDAER